MSTVYDLTREQLGERLVAWGEPAFRARQIHVQLWKRSATYDEMTDIAPSLRARLARELPLGVEQLDERSADGGTTRKSLLKLGAKGHIVEVVLMGYPERVTACISSQVGCGMGCGFCATGQMGLMANLTAGEIAAQVVWARREAARLPATTPQRLTNVVFMGMGEPLANYARVRDAIARLMDPAGMRLGARHVTVSTVGLVPGIRRLAQDHPQVGLAVSLHAASDELRDELVPINRTYPLAEVEAAMAGVAVEDATPAIDRVGDDRRNERLGRAGEPARAHSAAPGRARESDPVEPHAGLADEAESAQADRRVRAGVARCRRERDGARHAGQRHRCGLRAAAMGVRPQGCLARLRWDQRRSRRLGFIERPTIPTATAISTTSSVTSSTTPTTITTGFGRSGADPTHLTMA